MGLWENFSLNNNRFKPKLYLWDYKPESLVMTKIKSQNEFDDIVHRMEASLHRAFHKVNEELVLLYFKRGNSVPGKAASGTWGESAVGKLALYLGQPFPDMTGFNRRVGCIE